MKKNLTESTLFTLNSAGVTKKFLVLGATEHLSTEELAQELDTNTPKAVDEAVWGTIGWANDEAFFVNGVIDFSAKGQTTEAKGVTLHEIEDLYAINDKLSVSSEKTRVWERYINLSDLEFSLPKEFHVNELPTLRLTVFLKPNEGALVFKQHSDRKDFNDEEAFVEYLLPNPTDSSFSFDRDRLTYLIPIVPQNDLVETKKEGIVRLGKDKNPSSFIIKVLTFIREGASAEEYVQIATNTINQKIKGKSYEWVHSKFGKDKYALRLFAPNAVWKNEGKTYGGSFDVVDHENVVIDFSKKTLLLFHGTWSSTVDSFKHLLVKGGDDYSNPSFLQDLLAYGDYEQVIGFDRPTMSADVMMNLDVFFSELRGGKFKHPVDVITTSQGALVAEALSSSPRAVGFITIRRVVMFSAANGCGYVRTGRNIGMFLGVLRRLMPGTSLILAFAQQSVDWVVSNPGLAQMHPNSKLLSEILAKTPNHPSTEYVNIVSDWEPKLIRARCAALKKAPATLLDAMIKGSLGKKHDWVIGCDAQSLVPKKSSKKDQIEIIAMHGKYLDIGHVLKKDFLGYRRYDPQKMLLDVLRG